MKPFALGKYLYICLTLVMGILCPATSHGEDAAPPTVILASEASKTTNVSPISVTVTFSEPVTGFDATDVVLTNAELTNFAGEGANYQFDLVPLDQGAVEVEIPNGAVQDADGNANVDSEGYVFDRKWPDDRDWYFGGVEWVAVDSAGNVYFTDSVRHRVMKYDASGWLLAWWGSFGSGPGQFNTPKGIAVDASDRIYVADKMNNRVQVFTPSGQYVSQQSAVSPVGLAVDSSGGIHTDARGLAVDSTGNIYKIEGLYLKRYSPSGDVATIGGGWNALDPLANPACVMVDAQDNVYVSDSSPWKIVKYDPARGLSEYTVLAQRGYDDPPASGLAVDDASGILYAVDHGGIRRYDPSGQALQEWRGNGFEPGQFSSPSSIAADTLGNVYVADGKSWKQGTFDHGFSERIQELVSSRVVLTWTDILGEGAVQPWSIATDPAGSLYVTHYLYGLPPDYARMLRYSASGELLGEWGAAGSSDGQFRGHRGVAVDEAGNVYVVDADNSRIQKFDASGAFLAKWGSEGTENGQFRDPRAVAVDTSGTVYVADHDNHRVQAFDTAGNFLGTWGGLGSGEGLLNSPSGVAVDNLGHVFVADTGNCRIQEFDAAGSFLAAWGSRGIGNDQFDNPIALTVDTMGDVYVTDSSNHRVQKFRLQTVPGVLERIYDTEPPEAPVSTTAPETNDRTPRWTWVSGGGGHYVFRVKLDDNNVGTAQERTYAYYEPNSNLSDGAHTLYVQERDEAGNWSEVAGFTVTIERVPPNPPVITWVTPLTDNTPTWEWASGGGGNGTYRYRLDNQGSETETTETTFTSAPLSNGSHRFEVRERDDAGNWSIKATSVIAIDDGHHVPVVTGDTPTQDTTPTWSWSSGGGVGVGVYRYRLGNSGVWTETTDTTFTPESTLAYGTYALYVQERGTDGQWSASGSFSITVDLFPPDPPNVSGATPTDNPTPTWTWSSGGGGNGTFRYRLDGAQWVETVDLSFTPNAPLGQGAHTLEVQEQNDSDHWSASGSRTIVVDLTQYGLPTVTGDWITTDTTPSWSWTRPANSSTTSRCRLDGGEWLEKTGTSYAPASPLSDGPHTLEVQTLSKGGIWSAIVTCTTIVDTTQPGAPIVTGPTPTNDTTPTWVWTSGGGGNGLYRCRLDTGTWTTTTLDSFTTSYALYGTHTLHVQESDDVQNWSALGSFAITVDVTPPSPPNVTGPTRTEDTTPTWTWTSGDGGSGRYRHRMDLGPWTETTATSFTIDWALSAGRHTLSVQERDEAGNWSAARNFTTSVVIDPYDVDFSCTVNAIDVQMVVNAALGLPTQFDCDIDLDGKVNAIDVQWLVSATLGLI